MKNIPIEIGTENRWFVGTQIDFCNHTESREKNWRKGGYSLGWYQRSLGNVVIDYLGFQ